MLFQIETANPIDVIAAKLEASASKHQFGILYTHNLKETLARKGHEIAMECRVFEVCNPRQAKRVLDADGAISVALPCRISVYGSPDGAGPNKLATMLPTEMMKAFPGPEVEAAAREVETVLKQMMRDAAAAD
jgi:uncharacterized protein (DUF302 family)